MMTPTQNMKCRKPIILLLSGLLLISGVAACSAPSTRSGMMDATATTPPVSNTSIRTQSQTLFEHQLEQSSNNQGKPIVQVDQPYFYRPPDDYSPQEVAGMAEFIILSMNDYTFRQEVREAGYTGTILQYIIAAESNGPPGVLRSEDDCDITFDPWSNQVTYREGDFCRYLHPNEDWFLHNSKGERLYGKIGDQTFYHLNPASEGWRGFAVERMLLLLEGDDQTPPAGYDGIFLDNVELSLYKVQHQMMNSDGVVQEFDDEEDYRDAWVGYLWEVSHALRPEWPVWANLIADPLTGESWNAYMPYLDGGMSEEFVTGWPNAPYDAEQWAASLRQAEWVLNQDKGLIAVSQGEGKYRHHLFSLASYLLITDGEDAYFRYSHRADYHHWHQFDWYDLILGVPLNERYQQDDGTWRRDFSGGSVIVDPEEGEADIRFEVN